MKITAEPRSDQWNADDFVGGPRTFTVAGVKEGAAEQKYDILLEGEDRVWRPPLTMLRVLLAVWGDESADWVGRRVQLFQDPSVSFGRDAVGGIHIAALSHLDAPRNMKLTTTRGKRATYTVQPLKEEPKPDLSIPDEVVSNTEKALKDGAIDQYIAWLNENDAPAHILKYVSERKPA